MKKLLLATTSAFALAASFAPATNAGVENPYAYVVGMSAMNVCLVRFGYLTTEQAVDLLLETARESGISEYQVGNLMKGKNFKAHTNKAIAMFGGCSEMISKFTDRKRRSKWSLTGKDGLYSTDVYYGPNPAGSLPNLKELTP